MPFVGIKAEAYDATKKEWVSEEGMERRKELMAMLEVMGKNKVLEWRKAYGKKELAKFEEWQV